MNWHKRWIAHLCVLVVVPPRLHSQPRWSVPDAEDRTFEVEHPQMFLSRLSGGGGGFKPSLNHLGRHTRVHPPRFPNAGFTRPSLILFQGPANSCMQKDLRNKRNFHGRKKIFHYLIILFILFIILLFCSSIYFPFIIF